MKSRLIVYHTITGSHPSVRFAVPEKGDWLFETSQESWDAFASRFQLVRHSKFDWAAGDSGAKCALMEAFEMPEAYVEKVQWLTFPQAAKKLNNGECRRYLQLAVQYVSSGGIEDNLVASGTDEGLFAQIRAALENKAEK
jgi:hypothetical protein